MVLQCGGFPQRSQGPGRAPSFFGGRCREVNRGLDDGGCNKGTRRIHSPAFNQLPTLENLSEPWSRPTFLAVWLQEGEEADLLTAGLGPSLFQHLEGMK